jgi:hypothetical protein
MLYDMRSREWFLVVIIAEISDFGGAEEDFE